MLGLPILLPVTKSIKRKTKEKVPDKNQDKDDTENSDKKGLPLTKADLTDLFILHVEVFSDFSQVLLIFRFFMFDFLK